MAELTVRPAPNGSTGIEHSYKAFVAPELLVRFQLRAGDICSLRRSSEPTVSVGTLVLDRSPDKIIKQTVIQTTLQGQSLCALKLGDKIVLRKYTETLPIADRVQLEEESADDQENPLSSDDHELWILILRKWFFRTKHVSLGLSLNQAEVAGETRKFRIVSINGGQPRGLHEISPHCAVTMAAADNGAVDPSMSHRVAPLHLESNGLGALDGPCGQLNEILAQFAVTDTSFRWKETPPTRDRGVILHGPSGTGKSLLLQKLSQVDWCDVFTIKPFSSGQQTAKAITAAFAQARERQPSLIVMDDIPSIIPYSASDAVHHSTELSSLLQELDETRGSAILIVGACQKLRDVHPSLLTHDRLAVEIAMPIPDVHGREAILKVLSGVEPELLCERDSAKFSNVALRTHGFVAGDLCRLRSEAARFARKRYLLSSKETKASADTPQPMIELRCEESDYYSALRYVHPSAIREIFVEVPQVRWSDIGGQKQVKRYLEEALIWPYKLSLLPITTGATVPKPSSSLLSAYGVEMPRGLLLYGPPGCSKTMIAKAAATESGLNFIAIRGAELLNMYVGETERALRDIFGKARAAAPCILFFDEIDAIAGAREGDSGASASSSSSRGASNGINTVTTLLNELDGIDVKPVVASGVSVDSSPTVFVLAATNRPDAIDSALLRPGRLDTQLYIGPPGPEARLHILRKRVAGIEYIDSAVLGKLDEFAVAQCMRGRSGAEVVEVVQQAGKLAFREYIDLVQEQTGSGENVAAPVLVQMKHFFEAAERVVPRGITAGVVARYRDYAALRGQVLLEEEEELL